jgi:hypothetical protein
MILLPNNYELDFVVASGALGSTVPLAGLQRFGESRTIP